jgi:hypothetical protein
LALGITLTHGRWTEIAVEDIRRSSLELDSFGTSQTIESIFGQFVIVTICFGIAVLRPPPGFMGALVNPLEAWWISSAIWSGAMSAVMVAFGVSAAAAKEAMQEPHVPRRKIDVSAIVQLSRTAVFRCRTLGAPKWSVR